MATIVPTITAEDPHTYRAQIERVQDFASRIHVDLMDGVFTSNTSLSLEQVWLPEGIECDIHAMYQDPAQYVSQFVALQPRMVIVHAESECDIVQFAAALNARDIACGVAVFPETTIESIASVLPFVQQLLIFSGNLGHQGGSVARLELLHKVDEATSLNPTIEIAWDGGVNASNVRTLVERGVTSVNVGGGIHHAPDPQRAYQELVALIA